MRIQTRGLLYTHRVTVLRCSILLGLLVGRMSSVFVTFNPRSITPHLHQQRMFVFRGRFLRNWLSYAAVFWRLSSPGCCLTFGCRRGQALTVRQTKSEGIVSQFNIHYRPRKSQDPSLVSCCANCFRCAPKGPAIAPRIMDTSPAESL